MSSLCLRYGISRKTGYKWLSRYKQEGVGGLEERSRTPHRVAERIDARQGELILALKDQWPSWGPRKLLARLERDHPGDDWPAISTVGDFLSRRGLTGAPKRRGRGVTSLGPITQANSPNDVWSADFKGWFRTADGVRCEPLTISDNYSRFLFVCHAVPRITFADIHPLFVDCFRRYGLPEALLTDNGTPFSHRMGLGGLTRFSVWLLKLNIWPDRITPGCPTQNGRHERMHRTLAEDTASPPAANLALQQTRMDTWRTGYNQFRPHEALGNKCPVEIYSPSPRAFPEVIPAWDYPSDHHVINVNADGYIKWNDKPLYLTEALAREKVGVTKMDDEKLCIRFRNFDLAFIDEGAKEIRRSALARSGQSGT